MKSQKGSVTVIALIMLLFLVILGGAWTIMMTQSKTNALADEKQQQAWYAAEAGFKRAQMLITKGNPTWTNLLTAYDDIKTNNKDKFTTIDLTSGIENNNIANTTPWYAVSIVTQGTTTNLSAAPSTGTTYTITSVGQYMGERKVITRDVTFGSSGGGGGGTATVPDGFVVAGGAISVEKNWYHFNRSDGNGIFVSGEGTSIGTNNVFLQGSNTATTDISGVSKTDSSLASKIYSYLPESMFAVPSTATKKMLIDGGKIQDVSANSTLYVHDLTFVNGNGGNSTWNNTIQLNCPAANGSTIYFDSTCTPLVNAGSSWNQGFNGITGPTTGEPLTLIFNGDMVFRSLAITGRVRILVNGTLTFYQGSGQGLAMLLSNGDMLLSQSFGNADAPVFLSSNENITISGALTGRMQARKNITFGSGSDGNVYTYSNAVLEAFSLPDGMEVYSGS